jgi:type VI secretion system protein ImpL
MQKLLSVVKHRWFIAGVALLLLALVIWFVGPLLGIGDSRPLESATARILVIVLIIAAWVVVELMRLIRANRAAAQLSTGIAATSGSAAGRSAEEVAILNERFQEAVGVLRKSSSGAGAQSLYQLPWYIIIGPPGSGKTTALANSGLRFPLSDRFGTEALRGVGGTRNCDWWFTDEAILLDTAGRYTTQDSQAADDRAAWEGFLDLLKKHRRRRPINGVLVAISASDLMTLNDQARFAHARAIKQRIQELDNHFGIRFPVYLLLTKCDLIAGFMEYFEDLGNDERGQVWGVTLPMPEGKEQVADVKSFGAEFDGLLGRLEGRVLSRLHEEKDLRRRSLIYGFPRQLASLKGTLDEFVTEIFSGSRFEQAPLLRGLYLTSGTQEGAPIDRLMGAMARTFGLDQKGTAAFAGRGRSYFITRLLRDVVFQESGLAGTNRRLERRMAWLQRGAYAAVAVLGIALIAGWVVSYSRNSTLLNDAVGQVQEAEQLLGGVTRADQDPVALLPALDALRALPGGYADRDADTPFLAGLGLYQGEKLGRQSAAAYRRALVNQLLPRIMWRLEAQVDQADAQLDYTYEALKVYLMLGSEEHYDAEAIGAWVGLDWEARLYRELGDEKYTQLRNHLTALLEERPVPLPMPLDSRIVQLARAKLDRVSLEERIYARLRSSNAGDDVAGFNVRDAAGPDAAVVFVRTSGEPLSSGLPGLFTRDGYEEVFNSADSAQTIKDLMAERWVLKDDASLLDLAQLPELVSKVRDLYLNEYAKGYEELISDVQLASFANSAEAARMLNILSRPGDSPLLLLLEAVKRQTTFSAPAAADAGDENKADSPVDTAKYDRLKQLLSGPAAPVTSAVGRAQTYANVVEQKFAPISEQVASGAVAHLLELLRELAGVMMTAANQQSGSALPEAVARQAQTTIQKVQLEAGTQADPLLAGILKSASTGAATLIRGGVAQQIDTDWRAGPLGFCQRAIVGRYPFRASGAEEVRLEDFGRFFGYGGELDRFYQTYAKELVDTSRRPWRNRTTAGALLRLTPQALGMFERANSIKEAFFRGDVKPYVSFELKPSSMDASITRFTLTIAGQTVEYSHGPTRTSVLQWPGPDGTGDVRFEMAPQAGTSMRSVDGVWAWFRVLDDAGLTPIGLEKFSLAFTLDGRSARYELDARSAYNPFDLGEFRQFECVTNMSQ